MTGSVIAVREDNKNENKKGKPPGVFGLFKAAMLVLRHRTKGKKKAAQVTQTQQQGDWKKLVGSMRPLHLQDNTNIDNNTTSSLLPSDVTSPSAASSSSGTMSHYASANDLKSLDIASSPMSQYASANNLQELDQDDPDQAFDAIGADDMIDAKAELFILQFYQQMRRQNIDSISGQFN
ncbi:hypothetical protein P3S68_012346 [Capsicum galapagoense]